MQNDCEICDEKKFINPCGAANNCTAFVCKECIFKDWISNKGDIDFMSLKCIFCKCFDHRRALDIEFCNDVLDPAGAGCAISDIRVLWLFAVQREDWNWDEDELAEWGECIPCSENFEKKN